MEVLLKDETREYLARNDDGGGKPIGITGLIFGAVLVLILFFESVSLLIQRYL